MSVRAALVGVFWLQALYLAAQALPSPDSTRPDPSGRGVPADARTAVPRTEPLRPTPMPPASGSSLAQPPTRTDAEPLELLVMDASLEQAQIQQARLQSEGMLLLRRSILAGVGGVLSTYRAPDALRYEQFVAGGSGIVANHRYEVLDAAAPALPSSVALLRRLRDFVAWPPSGNCRKSPRIGLVDTAVEPGHPALLGSNISTVNILPAGVRPADASHGTAVASMLVGQRGTPALLPAAQLLAVAAFTDREGRAHTTAEWLVRALDQLAQAQVDVVNLSLGGPANAVLGLVLRRLQDRGIAVVAAAGNGGPQAPAVYPAAYSGVIAIVAVDLLGALEARAQRGAHIAFAAPGVDIPVAQLGAGISYRSGSSFAAPFVTAMLAAGVSERQLRETALDLGEPGRDPLYGWGLARSAVGCKDQVRS